MTDDSDVPGEVADTVEGDVAGVVVQVGAVAGGVGKTALALRCLHDVENRFPDGQLFADLGAFNPDGPVSPSGVLGRFLRALGIPAGAVPVKRDKRAELAEQAALYRSVTARINCRVFKIHVSVTYHL